jgi:HD-like signal output (HDOD) protein
VDELVPWVPRTAAYWSARRDAVLKEMVDEWRASPDAARWSDVDRLIERLRQGPMEMVRQLPAAARAAMALCDDEYLPRKSLSDKLAQDPSLVSSLLKQANSSLIGGGLDSVVSVDGAIDRIGVGGTRAVVVATSIEGLLSKPGPPYEAIAHGIWTHMVATAPIARVLAPAFGAGSDEAFATALLHDIGKLVVFDQISSLRIKLRRAIELPAPWLTQALDRLHEPLGAIAIRQWGLGAEAADAIGTHHRRDRPLVNHTLAEVVFLAEQLQYAERSGEPFDWDAAWALGRLQADRDDCRGLLQALREQVATAEAARAAAKGRTFA